MLGLCLVFRYDWIGSLGWLMIRFRVNSILIIAPEFSWGRRKWGLYINVIDNPKLESKRGRALPWYWSFPNKSESFPVVLEFSE